MDDYRKAYNHDVKNEDEYARNFMLDVSALLLSIESNAQLSIRDIEQNPVIQRIIPGFRFINVPNNLFNLPRTGKEFKVGFSKLVSEIWQLIR